eukprot:359356-Chlamydomonas_euryale.AAC.3
MMALPSWTQHNSGRFRKHWSHNHKGKAKGFKVWMDVRVASSRDGRVQGGAVVGRVGQRLGR